MRTKLRQTEHLLLATRGRGFGRESFTGSSGNAFLEVTRDARFLRALQSDSSSQRVTDQNPEGKYQAL